MDCESSIKKNGTQKVPFLLLFTAKAETPITCGCG